MLKKTISNATAQAILGALVLATVSYIDIGKNVRWLMGTCNLHSFCTPAMSLAIVVTGALSIAASSYWIIKRTCPDPVPKIAGYLFWGLVHVLAIVTALIVLYFFMGFSDLQHIVWLGNGVTPIWFIIGLPPIVVMTLYAAWFYWRRKAKNQ